MRFVKFFPILLAANNLLNVCATDPEDHSLWIERKVFHHFSSNLFNPIEQCPLGSLLFQTLILG